jgi:hypothetical protein
MAICLRGIPGLFAPTPFEWQFADRGLFELAHNTPNLDILLGMDILRLGTFATHGGNMQATFSW